MERGTADDNHKSALSVLSSWPRYLLATTFSSRLYKRYIEICLVHQNRSLQHRSVVRPGEKTHIVPIRQRGGTMACRPRKAKAVRPALFHAQRHSSYSTSGANAHHFALMFAPDITARITAHDLEPIHQSSFFFSVKSPCCQYLWVSRAWPNSQRHMPDRACVAFTASFWPRSKFQ